jgi:pimeloyl-ACP methyl ester carboxylesterase
MPKIPALVIASLLISCASAGAQQSIEPVAKDATVFSYKLHYLEAGSGPTVILLHGSGGEGARWMPTIKGLASDFRVIALDQIGFGASDKPLTIYHSGVMAGFLAQFMKTIGVPKAAIIGQSMGAGVTLTMAVKYPQMVERIVLVNGGGYRSEGAPARTEPPDWRARQITNAGTLEESREYLEKLYYNHSFVTDELVEYNLILRLKSAYTVESMQTANERGLSGLPEAQVRAIKTPTLLVWGANDKLSPPVNADKLNAVIQGSRKVLIDEAGHYPFIEHPDQFNAAVREFLKLQS